MKSFLLPDLGEGLQEAKVVQWHVAEGDQVAADQVVVSVETAKSLIDITAPCAAQIVSLSAQVDEFVAVASDLYAYQAHSETTPVAPTAVTPNTDNRKGSFVPSMPNARELAASYGYSLSDIAAWSQRDMVTKACVEQYHQQQKTSCDSPSRAQLREVTQKAWREVAQTVVMDEFPVQKWLGKENLNWVMVQALLSLKKQHPVIFSRVDDHYNLVEEPALHIAIPAYRQTFTQLHIIKHCGRLDRGQFFSQLDAIKNGRHALPGQLTEAHTILSNVGGYGGRFATPLCMPPLLSTFAVGRAKQRPHVDEAGALCVAPLLPISLAVDHRFVDGAEMVAALTFLGDYLTEFSA